MDTSDVRVKLALCRREVRETFIVRADLHAQPRPKAQRAAVSVLVNSYTDFELIVVDQSTDNATREAIAAIADERVRYIATDTVGVAISRNIAIREAAADIVVFTDDDCVCNRDWLKSIVAEFAADPQALGVYGRVVPYGTAGSATWDCVSEADGMICPALIAVADAPGRRSSCHPASRAGRRQQHVISQGSLPPGRVVQRDSRSGFPHRHRRGHGVLLSPAVQPLPADLCAAAGGRARQLDGACTIRAPYESSHARAGGRFHGIRVAPGRPFHDAPVAHGLVPRVQPPGHRLRSGWAMPFRDRFTVGPEAAPDATAAVGARSSRHLPVPRGRRRPETSTRCRRPLAGIGDQTKKKSSGWARNRSTVSCPELSCRWIWAPDAGTISTSAGAGAGLHRVAVEELLNGHAGEEVLVQTDQVVIGARRRELEDIGRGEALLEDEGVARRIRR